MENLFTHLTFIITLSTTITALYILATQQKKFYRKNFTNINWLLFCFLFFTGGWNISTYLNCVDEEFVFPILWTFYPAIAFICNLFIRFNFIKK